MKHSVREAYDLWAESYDSMSNVTRDLDALLLRQDLDCEELGQVLELGCGTGKNTRWLQERGTVLGLDFSEPMMDVCRRVAPMATLKQADIRQPWPVDDDCFDGVVVSLVLEHVEDLEHIAAESARVLRKGGWVRISELHPCQQARGKSAHFYRDSQRIEPEVFLHTRREFAGAFECSGFALQKEQDAQAEALGSRSLPRLLVMTFSL